MVRFFTFKRDTSSHVFQGGIMKITTYGIGGYDPTKPNNNIVEEIDIPDEEQE